MSRYFFTVLTVLIIICTVNAFSTDFIIPDAAGLVFVGTRRDAAQTTGSGLGAGVELFLRYNLEGGYFLSTSTGVYTVTDDIFKSETHKTTLLPAFELRLGYQMNPNAWFRPFFTSGFHFCGAATRVYNFSGGIQNQYKYQSAMMFGTGTEFVFKSSPVRFFVSGSYRYTLSSSNESKAKYWIIKTGISYHPKQQSINTAKSNNLSAANSQTQNTVNTNNESNTDNLSMRVSSVQNELREVKEMLRPLTSQLSNKNLSNNNNAYTAYGTPNLSDPIVYNSAYESSLDIFRKGSYQTAKLNFTDLLKFDPNHRMASNCQYWIGECDFAMGNYEEAIGAFQSVLQYPESPKKDDALLMLGQSYMNLNRPQDARSSFQELLNKYPGSEYVSRAQNYLLSL